MAINAMLTIGLTYVIILGGIDISVGSVAALAGVCAALVARDFMGGGTNIVLTMVMQIVVALVVGGICGSFNGFMITKFRVVPMIATLATQTIARGLCYILSGGTSVSGLTSVFSFIGAARFLKTEAKPTGWIPIITLVVIAFVVLMHILLS